MPVMTPAAKPQAPPVEFHAVPQELRGGPFVVWRYTLETDPKTGEAEWDKPPFSAGTGRFASSTNPKTWSSFAEAEAAYRKGGWDGIGYVLNRKPGEEETEGVVGIDLDKCRDPETGDAEPWALDVVRRLDSYTEVSPSGRGFRIFVLGHLPKDGRKKGKFECYQSGRYVTVTGRHVEGTPRTVGRRQAELEQVHRGVFGDRKEDAGPPRAAPPLTLADAEIVEKASRAKNGAKFRKLWEGDRSGYASPSEADLALCSHLAFWCGPCEERIADLFAQSGLFRSKWQREDYRRRTVGLALKGRTEYYDPRGRRGAGPGPQANGVHTAGDAGDGLSDYDDRPSAQRNGEHRERGVEFSVRTENQDDAGDPDGYRFCPITSAEFAGGDYRPEWVVRKVFARHSPGVMGGPKKGMKTSVMVDLGISIGTGTPFLGKFEVPRPLRVCVLSGESGEFTLQETARRICAARGGSFSAANVLWGFRLPRLCNPPDLSELKRGLKDHGVEVLLFDPLYLALLSGAVDVQASNFYQMGPLLLGVARACLDVGTTPLFAHHFRMTRADPYDVPDLSDLSYSGVGEFARQWLLLSRRERYVPGSGSHHLWMVAGGSLGFGGLWAVDVEEGVVDDGFAGRRWDVSVVGANEARENERGQKEDRKAEEKAAKVKGDGTRLLAVLDEKDPAGQGYGVRQLRQKLGWNSERVGRAVVALADEGVIEECELEGKRANGATVPCQGVRRRTASRDNPLEG